MDLPSISSAVTSLKTAAEIAKTLIELKSSEDFRSKVIELQTQMLAALSSALDAKSECLQLLERNDHLNREVRQLREQMQLKARMVWRNDVYWLPVEGKTEDGPYCPKCLDGSDRSARMTDRADDVCWRCSVCAYIIEKPGRAGGGVGHALSEWG